ncbi:hypothetical protein ACEWY4_022853 [Coilia grayii]|uniref:Reverse transcriptase domain-containing protein n=1 Tax=Coilia grayii TaxID=363190 RepID=A0ABD1J3Z2_9TELE
MADLNIITWNVRGLNSPIKRTRCLEFLHRKRASFAFIQETHLTESNVQRFQNKRYKVIAHSCAISKTRGVLILADRKLQLTILDKGSDQIGRFVYVLLSVNYSKVLLANIYAPNVHEDNFLPSISNSLLKYHDCHCIVTGDFNATLCPSQDRSTVPPGTLPLSSLSLKRFVTDLNLVDIWRLQNTDVKAYTFHSGRHGTSSRIDYIFISSSLINNTSQVNILPILISDHAPVICTLTPIVNHPKAQRWRFNTTLLSNKKFISEMEKQLEEFIIMNKESAYNAQSMWEATKCFMRGVCIGFSSKLKSERNNRLNDIEKQIEQIEANQAKGSQGINTSILTALRGEYKSLSIEKAEFLIHRTQQRYYFEGDRPSRLLALRLKQCESKAMINAIRTTEGKVVTQPNDINNVFKDFYSKLYKPDSTVNIEDCNTFLQSVMLPTLNEGDREDLGSPITLKELESAVKSLNAGKSPGLDGLPPEFYLTFWEQVGPLILDSINCAYEEGSFHRDQCNALITVLLKKGKDPLECASYRPISLICGDMKIYSKVLATRLEMVVDKLIQFDQTGFIKGRMASDNIRRLMHIIEAADTLKEDSAVFSLDAEKAFDLLELPYLWTVLERFGFGEKYISMLQTLYSGATASVLTGSVQSPAFVLRRGTRQGDPCSPLLFALSLEPLAQAIRESKVISPITVGPSRHHISLYADDCLLFFSNIQKSLTNLLALFHEFHKVSGYKINWTKSALLPLNTAAKNTPLPPGIPICTSFTYLGIKIFPNINRIIKENYYGVKKNIELDLKRWGSLQVSMQGRISTIKMNILPRINFLFFMIPAAVPPKCISEMHSLISKFIWGGKRARIKLTTLQRSKLEGGLAVPNLHFYYHAFQIRSLQIWRRPDSQVPWRAIEADKVKPHRLEDLLYTGIGLKNMHLKYGSIISNSLNAWRKTEKELDITCLFHKTSPLWNNYRFQSGGAPFVFSPWSQKGVDVFGDLFDQKALRTFLDIKSVFSLPGTSYFLYLRLRSAMKAYGVPWDQPLPDHPMERWISPMQCSSGTVSKMYNALIAHKSKTLPIEKIWERELSSCGIEIEWENIWENICDSSKNLAHQLIHYKLIHRVYATPLKRFQMKLVSSPECTLCQDKKVGTTMHMFWECTPIQEFWTEVLCVLSELLDINIQPNPCLCLLNVDSQLSLTLTQRKLLMAGFTAAKKAILKHWYLPSLPLKEYWLSSYQYVLALECTTARLNKAKPRTVQAWSSMLQSIQDILKETKTLD